MSIDGTSVHEEDFAVNQHLSQELVDITDLISLNEGCSFSHGCRIELIKQLVESCLGYYPKNQLAWLSLAAVCQVPTKETLDQSTKGKNYDGFE